jgi:hypothetical protein
MRSRRTASGFSCRARSTPSLPRDAETTPKPSNSRASVRPRTMWGSSSMIKIFLREATAAAEV